MVNFYLKKVVITEKQLELAKIGYREEIFKISNQMARTSKKESDELMHQINEYADAVMALEESLNDVRKSLNSAIEIENSRKDKEARQNEDNK